MEIHCNDEDTAISELKNIGLLMNSVGGYEKDTWVARNNTDRDKLIFFQTCCSQKCKHAY